ncbi:nuclear transport factor 2 family protein [Paraburkholderia silviterrae]|uniref:Nuclear transport factor 2 family protein n=1 Tax=Paraburkholderia silviterrae TaxID=2528715 RepID=A0A4R5M360_9BURK|nr:nuclear transport factor 2 family protein [Paraburkholderia silviterrae]TDG20029.1 nuclear transport factor 2 family protein [Paraburkholderia silviterrae]
MNRDDLAAAYEILQAHSRYAHALDERNWPMLDTVFAHDVRADYNDGEFVTDGLAELVSMIRSHLDGCGPTQHLLGTPYVDVGSDGAQSRIYVRAAHRGRGEKEHLVYEAIGEYVAKWKRTDDGWRATRWTLRVGLEVGSRDVLGAR